MLRRIAWMKWPTPIPMPSPSPPVTSTVRSWLASFNPLATGIERPCSVCMPYVLMKPGRFDEQPMPRTTATSWFWIWRSTSAFWIAASTPKSPHPGHQSGSTLPFRSAIVNCLGATTSVAIVDLSSNHDFVGWNRKGSLPGQLFLHRFHNVMRHKWFAIVLANVSIGNEARLTAQIARELAAEVILHDDGVLGVRQNLKNLLAVQRHQPANLQLIRRDPLLREQLASLFNRAGCRSPPNQRDLGIGRAPQLRSRYRGCNANLFAHALVHHVAALLVVGKHVADQHTVFHVLIARYRVDVPRHARNRARRNTALSNLVALVAALFRSIAIRVINQLAAIDRRIEVQQLRLHAQTPLSQKQVAKHDAWTLKLVHDIEYLRYQREAVADIQRRCYHPGIIPECGAQHLPQIALLGLRRHARRRASALAINHHHRNLRHRRQSKSFAHQRKTTAGGRAHRANSRMGRADGHVDHADLVLHLLHHDAGLLAIRRHPVQHTR